MLGKILSIIDQAKNTGSKNWICRRIKKIPGAWEWIESQANPNIENVGYSAIDWILLYSALHPEATIKCSQGNQLKFDNLDTGFLTCCPNKKCQCHREYFKSDQWLQNSKEIQKRREETIFKNYGVTNPGQSDKIREKVKETNLKKFGFDTPLKSPKIKDKIVQTNLERYGVAHLSQDPTWQEKRKNTCIEKYGGPAPRCSSTINLKAIETNLKRYGNEAPVQNQEIQDKIKTTNLKKYGVTCAWQADSIKQKCADTILSKYGVKNVAQSLEINERKRINTQNKYGADFVTQAHFSLNTRKVLSSPELLAEMIRNYGTKFTSEILEVGVATVHKRMVKYGIIGLSPVSRYETEIDAWLKDLDITFSKNNRKILKPKELDFYLPDHNTAIEFQGNYWHMNPAMFEAADVQGTTGLLAKDIWQRDIIKLSQCEALGIKLFQIWESEWNSNKEEIKQQILDHINISKEKNKVPSLKTK